MRFGSARLKRPHLRMLDFNGASKLRCIMGGRKTTARRQNVTKIVLFVMIASAAVWSQQPQTQTGVFPSPTTEKAAQTPQGGKTEGQVPDAITPAPTAAPAPQADATKGDGSAEKDDTAVLQLGPGDLLEVSVYGVPELTTKTRISNTGDVYLPLVDYVHVADLNLNEAQELIEKRLSHGGFVRNPHVTIFV